MGVSGSVDYMFESTAVIGIEGKTADEVLELMMEADVDVRDIIEEDETIIVYADPDQFNAVQTVFKDVGITDYTVAELTMLAQNDINLDEDNLAKFEKLIDALDDLEDVQQIYHNVDLG